MRRAWRFGLWGCALALAGCGGEGGSAGVDPGADVLAHDATSADANAADGVGPDGDEEDGVATNDAHLSDGANADTAAPDDVGAGDAEGDGMAPDDVAQDAHASDGDGPDASAPDGDNPDTSEAGADSQDASADTAPACQPTSPANEVCDGVDNDCNGATDEVVPGGSCDDGNLCTTDACGVVDGKKACSHSALADGVSCAGPMPPGTVGCTIDTCVASACQSKPKCDDGKPCTLDTCDSKTGLCTASVPPTSVGKACDDGDACTSATICTGKGDCAGTALICDDKDLCTADSCDKQKGCGHVALAEGAPCDDGLGCTKDETCKANACVGTKVCDDGDPCTLDLCDPKTAACSTQPIAFCKVCSSASDCADGSSCTTDACSQGMCAHTGVEGCADVALSDLKVSPAAATLGWSESAVEISWNVTLLGKAALTKPANVILYLTDDGTLDQKGLEYTLGACSGSPHMALPAPGETKALKTTCKGLPVKASGKWTIHAKVSNAAPNAEAANDSAQADLDVTYKTQPNLTPKALTLMFGGKPGSSFDKNALLEFNFTVNNNGNADGSPALTAITYFSSINGYDQTKVKVFGPGVAVGAVTIGQNKSMKVPNVKYGAVGNVYACVRVDHTEVQQEWSENDNVTCVNVLFK